MNRTGIVLSFWLGACLAGCGDTAHLAVMDGSGPDPRLPPPDSTLIPTVNIAPAIGWPEGGKPQPAAGIQVAAFAKGLDHPRWLYLLPNGDVLVAETNAPAKPEDGKGIRGWVMKKAMKRAGAQVPSANRITLLRDADHDGVAEIRTPFIEGLNSPFGMALVGNDLYVADTDKLLRFRYEPGSMQINDKGRVVIDLPGGPLNHHWTKNVVASPDGKKLYVTVGSNSNVGENGLDKEQGRAAIWEVDPASGQHRLFATGLRNPNGLAWEPGTGALWTAVNERDEIGSDLVPDYITSVKDGGFYGWPYSYYGQHVDARVKPQDPQQVAKALVPDYAVGPHTASLGLAFTEPGVLPPPFTQGALVGQHGSWNRKPHSGYKVIFVPFGASGKPVGKPVDLLTGFLDERGNAMGRPVGVITDGRDGVLIADDVGNTVWRVSKAPE
ncbi:MAG: sorbosone dehydrogenase family protein [Candidatus Pseudomonas phytovorans]|uniref:Sorbosone dehydrogenase family protein n=1 Tax=Candidatus Pseudomonas phytovorans TaxID=3121377 RepID=A0AAJ6BB52_9PSED|nr:sorbosone dehydrogenase family protein [Pseudomonas sp.]WEK29887.1 MAG: sorbosone dehydrogenase family protein [Pseudomonas sp.]